MIRSLRTGVSGIKSNQTQMDVIGNNVSNANTIAFKRGRASFKETLGQALPGSSANPSHIGMGTSIGSVDQSWTQGAFQRTGAVTDLALTGDGFFVVGNGDRNFLTRDGSFSFNADGEFVTSEGLNVKGWAFDEDGTPVTGAPDDVAIDLSNQIPAKSTTSATVGGNLSAEAQQNDATSISTSLYDAQGKKHDVVIEFAKTNTANEWDYTVTYGGSESPVPFGPTNGSLTFNTDGSLNTVDGNAASQELSLNWDPAYVDGGPAVAVDLQDLTQYSGSNTTKFRDQDGYAAGSVAGYGINQEGILEVQYTNGEQLQRFQLALGNVNNPDGLEQSGQNLYAETNASGDLQFERAGRDARTSVASGSLEMSNVDLATEFSDMIVAQRGYQASARVISTSDEMLQELVQLKR